MAQKEIKVTLATKVDPNNADVKSKKREFPIEQANKLLSLPKSAWKLDDSKFEWNGTEIAKK